MGSFENPEQALHSKGSPERLNEVEDALYKLLVPENNRRAINPKDFSDLYDAATIENDEKSVRNALEHFAERDSEAARIGKQRGELFESIINSQIAESDWMGPNADVIVPSKFDDIKNGVDGIVEFEGEEGANYHLALAVDVTESKQHLAQKFEDVKRSIRQGSLSKIKYFKSKNFRGELSEVPRVVVGADRGTINNISRLLLQFKRLQSSVAEQRKNPDDRSIPQGAAKELAKIRTEIAEHPLQTLVLTEAKIQLEAFKIYAQRKNKHEVVEAYTRVLSIIDAIIEEKGALGKATDTLEIDQIYKMIIEESAHFGEER